MSGRARVESRREIRGSLDGGEDALYLPGRV